MDIFDVSGAAFLSLSVVGWMATQKWGQQFFYQLGWLGIVAGIGWAAADAGPVAYGSYAISSIQVGAAAGAFIAAMLVVRAIEGKIHNVSAARRQAEEDAVFARDAAARLARVQRRLAAY